MYWSPQGSHQEPYGGSGSRPCQQWQLTAPGKGDLGKVVVVVCGVLVDAHVDEWVGIEKMLLICVLFLICHYFKGPNLISGDYSLIPGIVPYFGLIPLNSRKFH